MKKTFSILLIISLVSIMILSSCGPAPIEDTTNTTEASTEATTIQEQTTATTEVTSQTDSTNNPDIPDDMVVFEISSTNESYNGWVIEKDTITFSNLSEDTVCSIKGEFDGQIIIDAGDYKFELELNGVIINSTSKNPITIKSGDEVTITAKKGSENFIFDSRAKVTSDDDGYEYVIWSKCDLELAGKGELTIESANNKGIRSKKDIKIKNLTLSITCDDNALKGDDGVEITSGTIKLVSKNGDGIKTENTDISKKGKQHGIVAILGGSVDITAGSDGIDAAFDVEISDDAMVAVNKYPSCET